MVPISIFDQSMNYLDLTLRESMESEKKTRKKRVVQFGINCHRQKKGDRLIVCIKTAVIFPQFWFLIKVYDYRLKVATFLGCRLPKLRSHDRAPQTLFASSFCLSRFCVRISVFYI